MCKKIREPSNVTKVQSHVMLVLHNVRMVSLNVQKNKRTTKCDKSTVTCDIGIAQCGDGIIKYEKKKKKKPLNVTKVHSHVMLVLYNVRMVPSNVRKNKGTTYCGKSIIICDVGTT